MKSTTKIAYIKAYPDTIEEEVNKNLQALQVNTKVKIVDIKTVALPTGILVQITYTEDETVILNEEVK